MSGKQPGITPLAGALLISLAPTLAFGEPSSEAHPPLVLEVRYCECDVMSPDTSQSTVLQSFLEESALLRVAVPETDGGHLSVDDFSLEYEVHQLANVPEDYRFSFSATHTSETGEMVASADLVVSEDEWYPLAQTGQELGSDSEVFGLAIRLVDPGDS